MRAPPPLTPLVCCFARRYLQENIILNKVSSAVTPSCLDGREFIHSLMSRAPSKTPSHVIMNLPATAVEFLDAFRSWPAALPPPTVHVYCFVKCQSLDASDAEAKIRPRVEAALGCAAGELAVHLVRDVAPKKPMCCVSFRLPEAVGGLERVDLADYVEGVRKGSTPWVDAEEEEEEEGEGGGGKRRKVEGKAEGNAEGKAEV
jgi:tRNA (guanine37-N1)-methyltransferase